MKMMDHTQVTHAKQDIFIAQHSNCQFGAFFSRNNRRMAVVSAIVVVLLGTIFVIKKFGKVGDEIQRMSKITDYINGEMDRILELGTRDEQNEAFRMLTTNLPLIPVRMTLTTAVFKYTGTDPMVILKRIIHNPSNKLNEDYMSKNLDGPNIVKTLKTFRTKRTLSDGREQTMIWILSEFLDIKLSQKSIRGNENEIRNILRGSLKGLAYMHSRFIAHLDLKIGNIMGRTTSAGIVYKLIDFGYAQMMPSSGSVVIPNKNYGTYPYKPPEVVQKSAHGLKSDIWSLGGIAWFLSLQYTPFYLDNYKRDISAYKRFINSPALDSGNHRFFFSRNTSSALKSFIKQCMHADIDKRPSAKELLSHPFITGESVADYRGSSDEIEKDSSSSAYGTVH